MSTIKSNNHQVGQSATANQNFTLYQPTVPDGTVRLGVGNSGATTADALTVTNAGNATLLGNLTVSGAGTSAFGGPVTMGGIAAERIVQGTAQATTSGTAVGFTGIPSWVKRITVIFDSVYNSSGTGNTNLIQIGSGSYQSTGYSTTSSYVQTSTAATNALATNGFLMVYGGGTTIPASGHLVLTPIGSSNIWVCSGNVASTGSFPATGFTSGRVALSGTLDRVQLTCSSGTFTSGTINIIYEG